MAYIGNEPIVSATRTVTEAIATAGQTVFNVNGGYTTGFLDVILNGSQLTSADYTATNGSTVTLTQAALAGDEIRMEAWGTFQISSALTTVNPSYTGTLTGGTGVVNLGSGQFYKDSSGNIGIGTSSPSTKFDVIGTIRSGTASNQAFNAGWSSGGSQVYIQGYDSGTAQYVDTSIRGANLLFYSNASSNTERMRITSGGSVLVGTTTDPWSSGTGVNIMPQGEIDLIATDQPPLYLKRRNTDGNILSFFKNNSAVGTVSVTSNGTTYNDTNGIAFTATQSASSNPNCLDDYEEGTWTPTDASGAGLTFTVGVATYTKIGRLVTVSYNITYPATASGASAIIGGLPFQVTPAISNNYQGGVNTWNNNSRVLTNMALGQTTQATFRNNSNNTDPTNANLSGGNFRGVITYETT